MAESQAQIFRRADYGEHQEAMTAYLCDGERRAMELGNRGPISFNADGSLRQNILDAYWRCGFYVFTEVLGADELQDLEDDVADMWSRVPASKGDALDRDGRPALGADCEAPTVQWARPLSDPLGGTGKANGRHPAKMIEPVAPADAPEHVVQLILGSMQFSDACLRIYGHPDLLAVAAAVNGADFTPFNEAVWKKEPGLGPSVAWHQDGTTHWDNADLDQGTHGFNFMAQVYGSTAANGVWVVPGSHKQGKVDIASMVAEAGSDRLPDAVPMVCDPGDVIMCNRQAVHGSFANTSDDIRVTINFGFHRRVSVLGVEGGGIHNERVAYDDARIRERSRLIGLAIDARKQRFPEEEPYVYQPFVGFEENYRWNSAARAGLKDYNLLDLGI